MKSSWTSYSSSTLSKSSNRNSWWLRFSTGTSTLVFISSWSSSPTRIATNDLPSSDGDGGGGVLLLQTWQAMIGMPIGNSRAWSKWKLRDGSRGVYDIRVYMYIWSIIDEISNDKLFFYNTQIHLSHRPWPNEYIATS